MVWSRFCNDAEDSFTDVAGYDASFELSQDYDLWIKWQRKMVGNIEDRCICGGPPIQGLTVKENKIFMLDSPFKSVKGGVQPLGNSDSQPPVP